MVDEEDLTYTEDDFGTGAPMSELDKQLLEEERRELIEELKNEEW